MKKEYSGRGCDEFKLEDSSGTQTAAERQSAEAQLRSLISSIAPAHLGLVDAMRRWLQGRLPVAHEVVYEYRAWMVISYSPNERGYEGVLAIRASADGVKLFFNRGKELPDPEKLLHGSGKQTRSINVDDVSKFDLPAITNLIDEAIARNPIPFASVGRGAVVFRSASAKQR